MPLPMDTYKAVPVAKQDGSIVVTGEMNTDNLSPEARATLFERGVLELTEDAVLGETFCAQLMKTVGCLTMASSWLLRRAAIASIRKGILEKRPKITITIIIKKDGITIIIKVVTSQNT